MTQLYQYGYFFLLQVAANMSEQTPLLGQAPALHSHTKRLLSPNVVSMISVGSTIGTGLFFSIRNCLINGPLISIVCYSYIAAISLIIIVITCRLSGNYPINGSLCYFQFKFLSKSIGYANNLIYWFSWSLTLSLELSILSQILKVRDIPFVNSHPSVVIAGIWSLMTFINLLPINFFGYVEFVISFVKIVIILIWIVIVVFGLFGVNPGHKTVGFSVWFENWPSSFIGDNQNFLLSSWNCMIFASFTFQSIESIALTSGEIKSPSKVNFNKIIKLIFVRIILIYLVSLILLTLVIPYNDPLLTLDDDSLLSSPFIIALLNLSYDKSHIVSLFNIIIFLAIFSAANSNIYFGSRCLLATAEQLPNNNLREKLIYTNASGVPVYAILLTAIPGLTCLLLRFKSVELIFNFLLNCCASAGILMWALLGLSYYRYSKAVKCQNYLSHLSIFVSINIFAILATNGLQYAGDWQQVVGSYLTPALFVAIWVFLKFYLGDYWLIPIDEIDYITDRYEDKTGVEEMP